MQLTAFDAPYLERLQRGDGVTERHFFDYFGELIRIKLRSRLASREAVEDVRQETFVRVLTLVRANQIREPERLGALVNSVCNHVLLEYYRSRRKVGASLDEAPLSSFVSPEIGGAGLLEARETQLVVRNILGDLPERDRRLLREVFLEERDKDEVCRDFGIDRDYLRVLLHRAKQSFKSLYLKDTGNDEPAFTSA